MLKGAMDELRLGDPWRLSTDIGPVIDQLAKDKIDAHVAKFAAKDQLIKQLTAPKSGLFIPPTVLSVSGIEELDAEIFGPVLHVATFEANEIDAVVDAINAKGFGLTFGLHTRVDTRVERIVERVKMGNIYVNRNQIGAVVGSQPFGGEGLSGTGPKAGGPHYVARFKKQTQSVGVKPQMAAPISIGVISQAIAKLSTKGWAVNTDRLENLTNCLTATPVLLGKMTALLKEPEELPGPTGELNQLSHHPRGIILCLGPDLESLTLQVTQALAMGNKAIAISSARADFIEGLVAAGAPVVALQGTLGASALADVDGIEAVCSFADLETLKTYKQNMAKRKGALLPLITDRIAPERYILERHLCVDTTAAGGNASLLALSS